jgi:lipoprotein signal peptidase
MSVTLDQPSILSSCTEITQLVMGFTVGLAFGSISPSLGWLIVYIIIYEVLVWIIIGRNPEYWRGTMRITLNCAAFLGMLLGNWIITSETLFDSFLYDVPTKHEEFYIADFLDPILDDVNMWTRPQL